MTLFQRTLLPTVALLATISVAAAQQPEPDHQAHHPAEPGGAQTPAAQAPAPGPAPTPTQPQPGGAPSAMGPGGMPMMGGQGGMMNMDQMHAMMHRNLPGMMGQPGGMGTMASLRMMPFEHVEGRLAFLRTELNITGAQQPQWDTFAEAVRSAAETMRAMHESVIQSAPPAAWPDRLARQEEILSARLEALKAIKTAAGALYASFDERQKRIADDVMAGPMGRM